MSDDWARPVVHWEIEALDAPRQRAFYAGLFNWEIGDGPIMAIPAGLGGPEPGPAGHVRQGDRSGVALYVQVLDIRASLRKAADLGGTVIAESEQTAVVYGMPGAAVRAGLANETLPLPAIGDYLAALA